MTSDSRNKQTIGGRGPKSSLRWDVIDARELLKVQQRCIICIICEWL